MQILIMTDNPERLCWLVMLDLCWPGTLFPGSSNVPNFPNAPNVPNNVPNIPGHVLYKISMLGLNIGSGKLSSCMLSIGLGPKCEQGMAWGPAPLPLP